MLGRRDQPFPAAEVRDLLRSAALAVAMSVLAMCTLPGCGDETPAATRPDASIQDACPGGEEVPGGCVTAGVPAAACAEGFEADRAQGCAPVLPTEACGPGTLAVPGDVACREVAPCPEGKYGEAPLRAGTQFVDASFSGTSDGSEAKPWKSISAALAAAADDAVIAVAEGSYSETIATVGKSVHIWGRCPALVTIDGDLAAAPAVQLGEGGSPGLHAIAVTGPFVGIFVSGSTGVTLDRVHVHDTGYYGVVAADQFGPTSMTVTGSLIEGATGLGLGASAAVAAVEGCAVRDTIENADAGGEGLLAQEGAELSVARSVIVGSHEHGVHVVGSTATVTGSVVRGIAPDSELQRGGIGVAAFTLATGARGRARVQSSLIEQFAEAGVLGATADVEIESTVIRQALGPPASGSGVLVAEGSTLLIRSSLVERCRDAAMAVRESTAEIDGVAARDAAGFGAVFYRQSSATVTNSLFDRFAAAGIYVFGSSATIDGAVVRGTAVDPANGLYGDGIVANADPVAPGAASVVRARVEGSARVGMSSFGSVTAVSEVRLDCNPIQLDVETSEGQEGWFDQLGDIQCGCGEEPEACKVQSSMLAPPVVDEGAP